MALWVAGFTISHARYYADRLPAGVADATLLRRVYVMRAGASPYALAPVLSLQELDVARHAGTDWHAEGYSLRAVRLDVPRYAREVTAALATSGFLPMLGIRPRAGTLDYGVTTSGRSAIISDRLWRQAFGGASTALGAAIRIDGRIHTVIGILPSDFPAIDREPVHIWLDATIATRTSGVAPALHFLSGVVRLRKAADEQSVTRLLRRTFAETGSPLPIVSVALRPLTFDRFGDDGESQRRLAALALTLAGAVLLVALCNCMLLMAGSLHENLPALRIRIALGASPARLWGSVGGWPTFVMLMTSLGILATFPASLAVLRALGLEKPGQTINPGTFVALALVSCLSIALVNWGLIRTYSRLALGPSVSNIRAPARSHARTALTLCYLTVISALSVALVPAAKAYLRVLTTSPGFDASSTMVAKITVDTQHTPQQGVSTISTVLHELRALPGVTHAAASTSLPFDVAVTMPVLTGHADSPPLPVYAYHVLGDFLGALGLSRVSGRPERVGSASSGSVIINEALAARIGHDRAKLGACIGLGGNPCGLIDGIVRNTSVVSLGEPPRPAVYATMEALPITSTVFFLVRMGRITPPAVRAVHDVIQRALTGAMLRTTTLQEMVQRQRAPAAQLAYGGALLLAIGCALAFFGLRAVLVLHVEGHMQALGIHAALGASRSRMFIESTRDLIRVACLSVISGAGLGLTLLRLLSARLTSIELEAWPVMLGAAVALPMALALAALPPAWRASRMEPANLLRARAR